MICEVPASPGCRWFYSHLQHQLLWKRRSSRHSPLQCRAELLFSSYRGRRTQRKAKGLVQGHSEPRAEQEHRASQLPGRVEEFSGALQLWCGSKTPVPSPWRSPPARVAALGARGCRAVGNKLVTCGGAKPRGSQALARWRAVMHSSPERDLASCGSLFSEK